MQIRKSPLLGIIFLTLITPLACSGASRARQSRPHVVDSGGGINISFIKEAGTWTGKILEPGSPNTQHQPHPSTNKRAHSNPFEARTNINNKTTTTKSAPIKQFSSYSEGYSVANATPKHPKNTAKQQNIPKKPSKHTSPTQKKIKTNNHSISERLKHPRIPSPPWREHSQQTTRESAAASH